MITELLMWSEYQKSLSPSAALESLETQARFTHSVFRARVFVAEFYFEFYLSREPWKLVISDALLQL